MVPLAAVLSDPYESIKQSNYYDQIVQRYINTIAGQFFGHSHKVILDFFFARVVVLADGLSQDEFEIAYSNWNNQTADTADSVALICPALTPTSSIIMQSR
jgi:sphingomyelin phosphodiesterase